jgi:hypothetical protein
MTEEVYMSGVAEILLARGVVSERTLADLGLESVANLSLLDKLVTMGVVAEEKAARAIAEEAGLPYVTVVHDQLDEDLVRRVSGDRLHRIRALPLIDQGDVVDVAFADPTDETSVEEVAAALDRRVQPAVATSSGIRVALREIFGPSTTAGPARTDVEEHGDVSGTLRLYGHLLSCVQERIPELHVTPTTTGCAVQRRHEDGTLEEIERLGTDDHAALLARLRSLMGRTEPRAGLEAATLRLGIADGPVWMTAAIVPTAQGDAARMSIQPVLDRAGALQSGLSRVDAERMAAFLDRGEGAFVLNGPTRSRAAAVLDALLRERGSRAGLCVTVARAPGIGLDGALHIRAEDFDDDLRAATRAALALHADFVVLRAEPGDPSVLEAVAGARASCRVVLLGTWRGTDETRAGLAACGVPTPALDATLRGVVCLEADVARRDGED